MTNLIIIGTSTNARHAYEFVKMYNLYNVVGFAVNASYFKESTFCGLPVYSIEELKFKKNLPEFKVFIGLAWNKLNRDRRNLFELCDSMGFSFANLISPHAIISESTSIGRNCWIHDFAVISMGTQVGDNVVVRQYAMISNDCKVGSHCFFGVKSFIAGGCIVGCQSFFGIRATVFDDTIIGSKCIVGGCAVVKRNLPDFSKIISCTENMVVKQYSEDEVESKLMFDKNVR